MSLQATKPPSLRVGTTVKDPQQCLAQQLRPHLPFRVSTLTSQRSGLITCSTSFVLLGRDITLRVTTYRFDTNGTVLDFYTHRYWPIFHF